MKQAIGNAKIPDSWIKPLVELFGRESSWNPKADNPISTAYGYAQFLDDTRGTYKKKFPGLDYNSSPVNQLILGIAYIKDRYGDPVSALKHWDSHNWY